MTRAQYGIALDQHGNVFRFGKHCRKDLSEQIPGRVSIMYRDKLDGPVTRIGYVVGQHWLQVYVPVEEPA